MEQIKVIVRVRPLKEQTNLLNRDPETVQISPNCQEIRLDSPLLKHGSKCSKFDFVLGPDSTQEDVYSQVKGCVDSVTKGYNGCILAYGQTGSGKTYSMFGSSSQSHQYGGIIPRCISEIFSVAQRDRQILNSYNVYVSFMQVYNEQVYDLFSDSKCYQPLSIHETFNQNSDVIKQSGDKSSKHIAPVKIKQCSIVVAGLSELKVRNVKECLALLQLGIKNRNVRETSMNNASSRSHSIFQILVEQERKRNVSINQTTTSSLTSLYSKLSLVDLAGSERWNMYRDSNIEESQITELTNINSSLHTLGRCMAALVRRQKDPPKRQDYDRAVIHIPYRDSKLTRLLQDSLGGNATTILLATINPSLTCIEETISTLRFADRTSQVFTQAQVNEKRFYRHQKGDVESLQKEVDRLQKLLTQHGINYDSSRQPTKGTKRENRFNDDLTKNEKDLTDKLAKYCTIQEITSPNISCDLMVKAVSDVVHCCEIFLTTAASLKGAVVSDRNPSTDKNPTVQDFFPSINADTSGSQTKFSRESIHSTSTADRSKSKLSQLLIRRQQLTRASSTKVLSRDQSTADEKFKLEEDQIRRELKQAHDRKNKKTQLCTWLMEKEGEYDGKSDHVVLKDSSNPSPPTKRGMLEAYYLVVQQQLEQLNESSEKSHHD